MLKSYLYIPNYSMGQWKKKNAWMNDIIEGVYPILLQGNLHASFYCSFLLWKISNCASSRLWDMTWRKKEEEEGEKEEKTSQMPELPAYGLFITVTSIPLPPSEPQPFCCLWAIKEFLTAGNLISQTGGPWRTRAGSLQLVKGSCLLLGKLLSPVHQSCLHFAAPRG